MIGAGVPGALGGPEQGAQGNQAQDEVPDGYPSAPLRVLDESGGLGTLAANSV